MNYNLIGRLALLSLMMDSSYSYAKQKPNCAISSPIVVAQLNQVYYGDSNLRIFYTITGQHAVANLTDNNHNKVPDYVENIAIQANTIRQAWTVLGYQDPLKSPRYQHRAQYIDIQIQRLNGLGIAYDEPHIHNNNPLKKAKCALIIDLKSSIPDFTTTSSVVAHELFHLYGYGYTMFKQSWLTESTAAWSEGLITQGDTGAYGEQDLPKTREDLNQSVLQRTYKASRLWSRISTLTDKTNCQLKLPSRLLNTKYIDGQPVFRDNYLKGTMLMRTLLENLGKQDQQISKQFDWNPYRWKEKDQRAPLFNTQILNTIQLTLEQAQIDKSNNPEEKQFLKILRQR